MHLLRSPAAPRRLAATGPAPPPPESWPLPAAPATTQRPSAVTAVGLSLLVALAVALVAAALTSLHEHADGMRQRQLLVAEAERAAERLRHAPEAGGGERARLAARLSAAVAALAREPAGDDAARRLAAAGDDYLAVLRRASAGDAEPAFERFAAAASSAAASSAAHTAAARRLARRGSALAVGTEAALVALLLLVLAQVRRRHDARLAAEQARRDASFRLLLQHSADGLAVLDPRGRLRYLSPPVERLIGASASRALGRSAFAFVHPEDRAAAVRAFRRTLECPRQRQVVEMRVRDGDGHWHWFEVSAGHPAEDAPGVIVNFREIGVRRQLQEQLLFQALHDPLTRLANRYCLNEALEVALASADPTAAGTALLYLDLDDFKQVNDRFGHGAGDLVLVEVALRLRSVVRPGDVVARLGGDEFGILLERTDPGTAAAVGDRLLAALHRPIHFDRRQLRVGASIGIAHARTGDRPLDLLQRADHEMYRAKSRGKDRFCVDGGAPAAGLAVLSAVAARTA